MKSATLGRALISLFLWMVSITEPKSLAKISEQLLWTLGGRGWGVVVSNLIACISQLGTSTLQAKWSKDN